MMFFCQKLFSVVYELGLDQIVDLPPGDILCSIAFCLLLNIGVGLIFFVSTYVARQCHEHEALHHRGKYHIKH